MSKIVSQTKKIADLTAEEKFSMLRLLSLEFLGVDKEKFDHDLGEKDVVALLRLETTEGEIVGFSTLMTLELPVKGKKVKGIFSGDTTVLPEYRSSGGIGVEIGKYFIKTAETFPDYEVYYILISKGWRTYKVLPSFFRHFAPKYDVPTSEEDKAVMDAFGRVKYPDNYVPEKGLIVFEPEQTQRLVPGNIDAIPPVDPDLHTQYFLEKNATYLSGTELVCIGRVQSENFAPLRTRLIRTANKQKE